jgi:alpha-methylacyl-CoA racemase
VDGVVQPAAAPRFSRTIPDAPTAPEEADAKAALDGWLAAGEVAGLIDGGVVK